MKTVKLLSQAVFLLLLSISINSCKSDDNLPQEELSAEIIDCSTNIASGETLTLENRNDGIDYIIDCVFEVEGDFIIEPGVTIQFNSNAGIRVDGSGSIQAIGTSQKQINFVGKNQIAGEWRGVFIDNNNPLNELNNVIIDYAGGEAFNSNGDKGAIIIWANARLKIKNCIIKNSQTYGNAVLEIANNTITSCNRPMIMNGAYPTTISGGTYTGNATDVIFVNSDQISGDHTWTKLDVPYRITSGLSVVPEAGKLTINPGVIIEFGLDARLYINEGASGEKPSFIAVGTVEEPILFTSVNKVLGAWQGIYFDSPSPLNEIGFVTIEYASNSNQDGAIETWYGTVLNIHDVTFKNIEHCSIYNYFNTLNPNTVTTSNLNYTNVGDTICEN